MRTLVLSIVAALSLLPCTALAQHSAADKTNHHHASASNVSADSIWADLMAGNQRFVAGQPASREYLKLRSQLAKGQSPRTVVLGCADSRVSPELIFDKNLGDLFAVRAAGNVAGPIDLGSIEYAVEHLGSSVIVVLGHSECGAVKAACSGETLPAPNLTAIADKIRPACSKAGSKNATELSVEQNVRQSAKDLLANSSILREFVHQGKVHIIEAVYHLDSGQVVRLKD
jgi:carbonic anhydrase